MASGSTSNLGLSQWSAEDRVTREDFNADNLAIDAALASVGNCRIETGSYVGDNDTSRVIELTFSGKPMVLFIGASRKGIAARDIGGYSFRDRDTSRGFGVTWLDNSVRWTCSDLDYYFNYSSTYHYIALLVPNEEPPAE